MFLKTVRPDVAKYSVLEQPAGDYIPPEDQVLSNTAKMLQLHPFLVYFLKRERNT